MTGLSVAQNATPSTVPSKKTGKKPSAAPDPIKAGTITIPLKAPELKPEDAKKYNAKYNAAKYNKCGFDLEKAVSITLEEPEKKKNGNYILTIEQPAESQNDGGIVDKMTEYCAFDGQQSIGGQIDSHTAYGTTKITYWTCDQKDECNPADRSSYQIGDTNLEPYFENGKLIRRTQPEIQDKTPDKTEGEPK